MFEERLGHGWGMVGATTQIPWRKVGARLGNGWVRGMVEARLRQGWGMVGARTLGAAWQFGSVATHG